MAAWEAARAARKALLQEPQAKLHDLTRQPPVPRGPMAMPAAPAQKKTGRRRGGPPGQPPPFRQRLATERVSEGVVFLPTTCPHGRTALPAPPGPDDPPPKRQQVAELPGIKARLTEEQAHGRRCPCRGKETYATTPAAQRRGGIGPRLTAAMAYRVGSHGLSKRAVAETVETLFEVPLALGTVANLGQARSAALARPHAAARPAVEAAPVKHADETGGKEAGRKRRLGVAAPANVAVFVIQHLRSAAALSVLVGKLLRGIVCSDRWRAYDAVPVRRRHVCGAHRERDFERLVERGGRAAVTGSAGSEVHQRVFDVWHWFRSGGCSRRALDSRRDGPMIALPDILHSGRRSRDRRTARFGNRLGEVFPSLWAFVLVEGVEPTNDHAERLLRRAVRWRRRAFGCASAAVCRFVERLLTVVQTLRLPKRPVSGFLGEALAAHRSGQTAPRLVLEG